MAADDFCPDCGTSLKADASTPSWSDGASAWDTPADSDEWGATLGSLSAFEEEERLSAFAYEKRADGSFVIKGIKDKYALTIAIPEGVSVIAASAFENSSIMEVTLPEGLTMIGERAFFNCNNLQKLVIPRSVMIIAEEAFADSEGLTVKLLGSPRVIGEGAFRGTVNERNGRCCNLV